MATSPQTSHPVAPSTAPVLGTSQGSALSNELDSNQKAPILGLVYSDGVLAEGQIGGTENRAGTSEDSGDEDENNEDGEDEDEYEDNMDFKCALEDALQACSEFKGTFGFSKTYDAPNPGLLLANLGHVGLPLSDRDANSIISICEQAPFGQGERTVVDKEVRDTWQIDGSQVGFTNPEWFGFLGSVIQEVCATLGVNINVSQPRCDLYKLLLYETGSHFLPHVDTEKVDGMFATIIIILPSRFTGGAVHLAHDGETKVVDLGGHASPFKTSVLAWYSDVSHEVKPVESGHRFALAFNLVHTTNTLRPIAPIADPGTAKLKRILKAWNGCSNDDAPEKLVYLLAHKYSHANLRGNALKGVDAHKVSRLMTPAEKLGFRLGLATLEKHVRGYGEEDYGGRRGGRGRYYDDYDHDNVTMGEVEKETITMENLVSLDGSLIQAEVDFDGETEMIPENWKKALQSEGPDETEYEGYQGNAAGTLEYFYRRTVLVIWPGCNDTFIKLTQDALQIATNKLQRITSLKPSREESSAVEYVLSAAGSRHVTDPSAVVRALCMASCCWKDIGLWLKSLRDFDADQGIQVLGLNGVLIAITAFGLPLILPTIDMMLTIESSIKDRLDLILAIQPISGPEMQGWVARQKLHVLEGSKTPTEHDITPLLELSLEFGFTFCASRVIPKLRKPDASGIYYLNLAQALYRKKLNLCQTKEEQEVMQGMVCDILKQSIAKADFFKISNSTNAGATAFSSTFSKPGKYSPNIAVGYVQACFQTENIDLVQVVVTQLASFYNCDANQHPYIIEEVVLPCLAELLSTLKAQQPPLGDIEGFGDLASLVLAAKIQSLAKVQMQNFQSIGCGCLECQDLIKFLTSSSSLSKNFIVGADKARHLESRLGSLRGSVTCRLVRTAPRYSLQVDRKVAILSHVPWNQQVILQLLQSFGPSYQILGNMLGTNYGNVLKLLSERDVKVGVSLTSAPQSHPESGATRNIYLPQQHHSASGPYATSSNSAIQSGLVSTPNRLKRKYDDDEVIDLTTP